jgi:hypothetical protein
LASSDDGYSLYTMAQMNEEGFSGLEPNYTLAVELYDQLIQGAESNWYRYEEKYPALISKYSLIAKRKVKGLWAKVKGWLGNNHSNSDL